MSRHEGVSCDACLKSNFRGRRYKCLICYDYDLCANCYEEGATSTSHSIEHPMQCILTRADFDIYYGGEALNGEQPQSFTCPYCKKMGYSDTGLYDHVSAEHTDTGLEVVCPVCAALPGGDPNLVTDDFAGHLTLEHRTGPRDLMSFLDEPSAIRHGGVRRITAGRGLSGPRSARRSHMNFSSSGISALSPSGRETVDPIAELLSQLSGVRRGAPQPSQLQQLQMQIQLERQHVSAARQQLERLPRRPHPVSSSNAGNMSNGAVGSSANASSASSHQQASIASTSGRDIAITSNPLLMAAAAAATNSSSSGAGSNIIGFGTSTNSLLSGLQQQQTAPNTTNQSQYLLTRFMQPTLDDSEVAQLERSRADRSQFVQALLLSTLSLDSVLDVHVDAPITECSADAGTSVSDETVTEGEDNGNGTTLNETIETCDSITTTDDRANDYEAKKRQQQQQDSASSSDINEQLSQPNSQSLRGSSTKPKTGSSKSNVPDSRNAGGGGGGGVGGGGGIVGGTSERRSHRNNNAQPQQPSGKTPRVAASKEAVPGDTR